MEWEGRVKNAELSPGITVRSVRLRGLRRGKISEKTGSKTCHRDVNAKR